MFYLATQVSKGLSLIFDSCLNSAQISSLQLCQKEALHHFEAKMCKNHLFIIYSLFLLFYPLLKLSALEQTLPRWQVCGQRQTKTFIPGVLGRTLFRMSMILCE